MRQSLILDNEHIAIVTLLACETHHGGIEFGIMLQVLEELAIPRVLTNVGYVRIRHSALTVHVVNDLHGRGEPCQQSSSGGESDILAPLTITPPFLRSRFAS